MPLENTVFVMITVFVCLQLIDDSKTLSEKCETLVKELKQVDKKYQDRIKGTTDKYVAADMQTNPLYASRV